MNAQSISPHLRDQIASLEKEEHLIPKERKEELNFLAQEIKSQISESGSSKVTFVCTHNSRRSQLAQIWLRAAAEYYDFDDIRSYSGGTEATTFNPRMVDAVSRFGFFVNKSDRSIRENNHEYKVQLGKIDKDNAEMFSKKYNDPYNPQSEFIAVMVCSQADKECPIVPGAFSRISLPYEDPKNADNTPEEKNAYDQKVREIGREILYVGRSLKGAIS